MSKQRGKGCGSLFRRGDGGPWIASWFDHAGRRRERSTKTTCKRTAETILREWTRAAALRVAGVVTADADLLVDAERRPLSEHVAAYLEHCRLDGLAATHLAQKRSHLHCLLAEAGIGRLSELTADVLRRHLAKVTGPIRREDGTVRPALSARSYNFIRGTLVAFMSWAVKEGRTPAHSLERVARRDVDADRRRIRRALSVEEAERLLAVAREHGREAWYACALYAGLRKGDMLRLSWRDVDFKRSVLTVVGGKHGGADPVPMHPKLVEILLRHRGETKPMPASRVFPVPVHDERRVADFTAAGIALVDEMDHVADLHSLRATCCTWLARAGVPVQIAKLVMRHRQAETTEKHYTKLGLLDATGAVAMLPVLGSGSAEQAATGTAGATAGTTAGVADRARDPIGRNPLSTLARPAGLEPTTLRSVVGVNGQLPNAPPLSHDNAPTRTSAHNAGVAEDLSPGTDCDAGSTPAQAVATSRNVSRTNCGDYCGGSDPDLRIIVAAWPHLPEGTRGTILELVRNVGTPNTV